MKKVILFVTLLIVLVTAASAQQQWKSQNPLFIDDLPFDQEGNLVFSEIILIPSAKASELYMLFDLGVIPAAEDFDKPEILKDVQTVTAVKTKTMGREDEYNVRLQEKWEFKEGKIRLAIKVIEVVHRAEVGNTGEFRNNDRTLDYYFSKSKYFKSPGVPTELNKDIRDFIVEYFTGRSDKIKKLDIPLLIAKAKEWKKATKENDWKSSVPDLPAQAPFSHYVDADHIDGPYAIVYKGFIPTALSPATQINRLIRFMNLEANYDDWMGSESEGMIYDVKDSYFEKNIFYRSSNWNLALIPETGGCRYEFTVTTITECLPTNIYIMIDHNPAEYVRTSKDRRVEQALKECNTYAQVLLNKFSAVFITEKQEQDSWNAGIKNNDWRGTGAAYPSDLPFDPSGRLKFEGVMPAPKLSDQQYDRFIAFLKNNYELYKEKEIAEIWNEKLEKQPLLLKGTTTPNEVNWFDNGEYLYHFASLNAFRYYGIRKSKKFNDFWIAYTALITFSNEKVKYEFIVTRVGKEKITATLDVKDIVTTPADYLKGKTGSKESETRFILETFDGLVLGLQHAMSITPPTTTDKKKSDW